MKWSGSTDRHHTEAEDVSDVVNADVMSDSRTLVRRIVIYMPGSVIPAVLALVTSMIFTRIFTPAEFGMFSLAGVVVAIPLKTISTTWLVQSVGKFLPPQRTEAGRRRTLDAVALAIGAIVLVQALLGCLAIVIGKAVLSEQWHRFLIPVVLFVLSISLFEILSAVLSAEARATEYTAYKLVDSIVTLGLRLLFVSSIFHMDITAMLLSVAISNGVLVPLMWRRAGLGSPTRVTRLAQTSQVRATANSFAGFGFPMTLWLLSSILLDVGDRWVLNGLLGAEAVGIYDANYRLIGGVAALLVVPVTITVHPYLMGLSGAVDKAQVGRVIGTVIDNLVIVALLAVGLTFLLREDIALILLGPQFREGSAIMAVVLAGVFCGNIGTFAHKPFEIVGRTRLMVVAGFTAAAANLVFCFVLIPAVGYVGAAYATLLAYLLYTVMVGALGMRIIPWRLDWKRIFVQGAIIGLGVVGIAFLRSVVDASYPVELTLTGAGCAMLASVILLGITRRSGGEAHRGWFSETPGQAGAGAGATAAPAGRDVRRQPAAWADGLASASG